MSFAEVREYQMGDDIRTIDWNVTARMGSPYVKVFEEERELSMMLMVDVSGSSFFGTRRQLKSQLITEICAVLAFSALRNNDKVGVLFFGNQPKTYIPPRKGRFHGLRIIRELLATPPSPETTDLNAALAYYNQLMKKRSILFVLSDFISPDYLKAFRMAARRHDLIGLRMYDQAEKQLPRVGWLPMMDTETGRIRWRNTQSARVRSQWQAHYRQYQERFQETCRRSQAGMIEIGTHEDYIQKLHAFFRLRER